MRLPSTAGFTLLAAILLVCGGMTGCASVPGTVRADFGIELPPEWGTEPEHGEPPTDAWWARFEDPELEGLVAEALENNRDLQAAAARVEAAAAESRIAEADLFPQTGAGLDGSRRRQIFTSLPIPGGVLTTTTTRLGVSLDTTWEVDLWGRIRAGAAAAIADYQASAAELAGSRLSIAGQTAKAWFGLTEARLQRDLTARTVESFRSTVERVRTRFESGLRSSLDLRLALSDLAAGEALHQVRAAEFESAARQLEILLGRYPAAEIAGAADLPPVPPSVPEILPAEILARRPDLAAAERRLAAADARVAQARRSLYPRLSLTGNGGSASDDLGDLLDGDFSVWGLAVNLFQPVFQGGRLRAGVDRARAGSEGAVAEFADSVLAALAEVESTLADEHYLRRRQEYLERASGQAEAALELVRDRYDSGLEDLITVLEAQRRSLNRQTELLAVRRIRLQARVDLYLALGGGFEYGDLFEPPEVAGTPPPERDGPS